MWRWVLTLRETRDFDELDASNCNYEKLEKKEEKRIYDYNVKNI